MITAARWAAGPTPLSLAKLVSLTRAVAAEVAAGIHVVRVDPRRRWYRLLRSDAHTDVWLISWAKEQSADLHDHAGSLGALTVVAGELTEWRWAAGWKPGLRRRSLRTGGSAGFPLGHVHDVVNLQTSPAVSVHAYSPPLTAMSYYTVDDSGALRRTRSVLTAEPEPTTAAGPAGLSGRQVQA